MQNFLYIETYLERDVSSGLETAWVIHIRWKVHRHTGARLTVTVWLCQVPNARHASTAKPTLLELSANDQTIISQEVNRIRGIALPALLFSNHIVNEIPIEVRKHASQGSEIV